MRIPDELRTNVSLAYCPCEEAYRTRKEPLSGLFSCKFALKRVNSLCAAAQARGVMGVGAVRRERCLHLLLNFELLAAMRPDLMLLYGVTGENTIVTGKLR